MADPEALDLLMRTSRVMTAVVARTLAGVPDTVTVPQLRVLVLLDSRGELNLGAVATALGVNPSNASRTCDKLVDARLVRRTTDPEDRRRGILQLTAKGRRLVSSLMDARRSVLDDLLSSVPQRAQRQLAQGLAALLTVVDGAPEDESLHEQRGALLPWLR